jgi:hypothetical protein
LWGQIATAPVVGAMAELPPSSKGGSSPPYGFPGPL